LLLPLTAAAGLADTVVTLLLLLLLLLRAA
jgi:hypothetical protein